MNTLTTPEYTVSVLIVDEEPSILISLSRILETNGIRALLARNANEAVEIAKRSYIPIDLVLSNAAILELHGPELLDLLRQIRPGVRDVCMAACIDEGVLRIQLMAGFPGAVTAVYDSGLVESIQRAISAPLSRGAGFSN